MTDDATTPTTEAGRKWEANGVSREYVLTIEVQARAAADVEVIEWLRESLHMNEEWAEIARDIVSLKRKLR